MSNYYQWQQQQAYIRAYCPQGAGPPAAPVYNTQAQTAPASRGAAPQTTYNPAQAPQAPNAAPSQRPVLVPFQYTTPNVAGAQQAPNAPPPRRPVPFQYSPPNVGAYGKTYNTPVSGGINSEFQFGDRVPVGAVAHGGGLPGAKSYTTPVSGGMNSGFQFGDRSV
ncbi:hypothetical protein MKEN_00027400 [Mycena kentingensis (nom. inval.)]|nr:hypothetical protein MKEN_00027400 [Mycena kentingensis (nom. inval.)]